MAQANANPKLNGNAHSSELNQSDLSTLLKIPWHTMAQASTNSEFNEYALSSELNLPDMPMFFRRHIMLLAEYLLYPYSIPGDNVFDRAYSIGAISAWIQAMTLLVPLAKVHSIFEKLPGSRRPGLMTLTTRNIRELNANGDEKALLQLCDHTPRENEQFDYFVAFMLLIMSAGTYDRRQSPPKRLQSPEDTNLFKKFEYQFLGEPKAYPGASAELFANEHATVLVFGSTATAYDECLVGATFFRDNHSGSYRKFLAGQIHKGFYDSLFGVLNTAVPAHDHGLANFAPSKHGSFIRGPLTPMKCIMEDILTKAFQFRVEQKKLLPINLWITGHSIGGALASLAMAYLQSVVGEYDSLLDGWNVGGQNVTGAGSTVLEVMTAQFYKDFSSYNACRNCQTCKKKQLKSCNDCYDCKNFRLNALQNLHESCEACMQRIDEKRKAFNSGNCLNCKGNKSAKKSYSGGLQRCKACDYCDECGNCDYCKARRKCPDYRKHKELVVLRDCYTFGSPKVGDAAFARAFVGDQLNLRKNSLYKPVYWRIVNQGDLVTMLPPGRDTYAPCIQDPGCRSSLLDYQHVGHLVEICPSERKPTVSLSKFEEAFSRDNIKPDYLSELVLEDRSKKDLNKKGVKGDTVVTTMDTTTKADPDVIPIAEPNDFIKMKLKSLLRMAQQGLLESTARMIRDFPVAFTHSSDSYKNSLSRARTYFKSFPED